MTEKWFCCTSCTAYMSLGLSGWGGGDTVHKGLKKFVCYEIGLGGGIHDGKIILLHILYCFLSKCLLLLLLLLPISSLLPLLLVLLLQQHLQQLPNLCVHVFFFVEEVVSISIFPKFQGFSSSSSSSSGYSAQDIDWCSFSVLLTEQTLKQQERKRLLHKTNSTVSWNQIKIYLNKGQADTNFNSASYFNTRFTTVWYSSEPYKTKK